MYEIVFGVHLTSLAIAIVGILFADKSGFAWIRGKTATLDQKQLHLIHNTVSLGLVGLIASGVYLLWPQRSDLLVNPLFLLKMFFVATLIINSFAINFLTYTATQMPYADVPAARKRLFLISGAVSTIGWLGTVVMALILFAD